MRAIEAYQTFNQGPSASAAISVNVEISGSKSKSSNSDAIGSILLAGNDINLTTTNQDIKIKGSNLDADNNINITSGNDLEILASQNNSNNSSKSFDVEVDVDIIGTSGAGATDISASISKNKASSLTNNNATISANNNLNINTNNNTNIKGANLIARNDLILTSGNNLNIESLQDVSKSKSDSLSIGVGFGEGAGKSGNIGVSTSKANKQWVNNQTSIIGQNSVTINTGNKTNLKGALIANKAADGTDQGNLTLNTQTLTYSDIQDKDKARSLSLGVGIGNDPKTNAQQSGNFNFDYSSHDIEQLTKATIGQGTLNITDDSNSIAELNRDITKSQEITKYQKVDPVSGSIIFQSKEQKQNQDYNTDGTKKTFIDKAQGWLRPDKTITGSIKEAAKVSGNTDLERSIERGEDKIDDGLNNTKYILEQLTANNDIDKAISITKREYYNNLRDEGESPIEASLETSREAQAAIDIIERGIERGDYEAKVEVAGLPLVIYPLLGTTIGREVLKYLLVSTAVTAGVATDVVIDKVKEDSSNKENQKPLPSSSAATGMPGPDWDPDDEDRFSGKDLDKKYSKHQKEFGNISKHQYKNRAMELYKGNNKDILSHTRSNGDVIKYNKKTNEFISISKSGKVRTFFKPTRGAEYWKQQTKL